jgi:hypothetical protein
MMIIVALSALAMGLLRLAPSLLFLILSLIFEVFLFLCVVALIARLFAAYDWLIRRLWRRLSRGQSPIAQSREKRSGVFRRV